VEGNGGYVDITGQNLPFRKRPNPGQLVMSLEHMRECRLLAEADV
jgi:hypothetical protein